MIASVYKWHHPHNDLLFNVQIQTIMLDDVIIVKSFRDFGTLEECIEHAKALGVSKIVISPTSAKFDFDPKLLKV